MDCPLCGAQNELTAKQCYLCSTALTTQKEQENSNQDTVKIASPTIQVEQVDLTTSTFSKKKVLIALSLALLLITPWIFMADLLANPWPTVLSRHLYDQALSDLKKDEKKWTQQKEDILQEMRNHRINQEIGQEALSFQQLPLSIWTAFISQDLGFGKGDLKESKLFLNPEDPSNHSFLLSKYEDSTGPLSILLSLSIQLENNQDGTQSIRFITLKRGKRTISNTLAWDYFQNELNALRKVESYTGGIQGFNLSRSPTHKLEDTHDIQISWVYSHPNFFPERLPIH